MVHAAREKVAPAASGYARDGRGWHAFLAVKGMHHRNDTPSLFTLVRFARENRKAPTRSEALLWRELRARRLGFYFRRQHPISAYIVDFACTTRRLVVEIDGGVHRAQRERDAYRQRVIEGPGWRVVRVEAELSSGMSRRRLRACERRFRRSCGSSRHWFLRPRP